MSEKEKDQSGEHEPAEDCGTVEDDDNAIVQDETHINSEDADAATGW